MFPSSCCLTNWRAEDLNKAIIREIFYSHFQGIQTLVWNMYPSYLDVYFREFSPITLLLFYFGRPFNALDV